MTDDEKQLSRRKFLGTAAGAATASTAGCISNPFSSDEETVEILEGIDREQTESDARELRSRLNNTRSAAEELESTSFPNRVDNYRLRAVDDQRGVKATEGFVLGIPTEGTGVQRESNADSAEYRFLEGTEQLGDITSFEELEKQYDFRGSQTDIDVFEDKWDDLEDMALFTRMHTENNQPILSENVREELAEKKKEVSNQRVTYEQILKNIDEENSPMDIRNDVENLQNRVGDAEIEEVAEDDRGELAGYLTTGEWTDLEEGKGEDYEDIGLEETKEGAVDLEENLVEEYMTLTATEAMLDYAVGEVDRLQEEYGDGIFDENAVKRGKEKDPKDDDDPTEPPSDGLPDCDYTDSQMEDLYDIKDELGADSFEDMDYKVTAKDGLFRVEVSYEGSSDEYAISNVSGCGA